MFNLGASREMKDLADVEDVLKQIHLQPGWTFGARRNNNIWKVIIRDVHLPWDIAIPGEYMTSEEAMVVANHQAKTFLEKGKQELGHVNE